MAFDILSETQRKIQAVPVSENVVYSRDLPRDTVLKSIALRLSGYITTTYASGTPVANQFGAFDNICPRVEIIINGNRVIKSVRPFMMRSQQIIATGNRPSQQASAGASSTLKPTAEAVFTYGTTGQITSLAESIIIPFENNLAEEGKDSTYLNLKGVASAEIRFTFGAFSSFLGFGNTAPVVYSASTLQIDMTTQELQSIPAQVNFSDFKQTTKEITFSAETVESVVEINRGNFLQNVMFLTRDGAAGSATTATGKIASDNVLKDIKLVINGQRTVKATDWYQLQDENRSRYGLNTPYVSNSHPLVGVALLNLLQGKGFGALSSALDVRPPDVDQCQMLLTTRSASDVSYTNPVSVTIMTSEMVLPRS